MKRHPRIPHKLKPVVRLPSTINGHLELIGQIVQDIRSLPRGPFPRTRPIFGRTDVQPARYRPSGDDFVQLDLFQGETFQPIRMDLFSNDARVLPDRVR
jgi:hypothetical protein